MILGTRHLPHQAGPVEGLRSRLRQGAASSSQASPGFQKLEMRPCIEVADRYLLLVWWDSVEAHMKGFRESEGFKRMARPAGTAFRRPAGSGALPGSASNAR